MRRTLLLSPLVAALAVAACHKGGTTAAPAPALMIAGQPAPAGVTTAMVALGDSLFNSGACQRCHGQKGVGGNNGPSLVAGPWLHHMGKYEEIVGTIITGVPRAELKDATRRFPMNPRGGPMNLTDDQVKTIAAYVWSISRNKK